MGENTGGRFITLLLPASLIYLLVPNLIFIYGWLQSWIAIPFSLLLLLLLFQLLRQFKEVKHSALTRNRIRFAVATVLVAISLTIISGIGGLGFQDSDWIKHNSILIDLIDQPWPVYYEIDSVPIPLVYYIAFYLPGALVGKFAGWGAANLVLFIFSLIGLVLVLAWFGFLIGSHSLFVPLVFIFFSGLDFIGQLFIAPQILLIRPEHAVGWEHIEWWAFAWQYSAFTTQYFWVPNQAIAGWILTGVVLYATTGSCLFRYRVLVFGLVMLWSPFVAIGAFPFLILNLGSKRGPLVRSISRYFSFENLVGLLLILLIGGYYGAKLYQIAPTVDFGIKHGFILSFAETDRESFIGFLLIVVFCVLEFGLYAGVIWLGKPERDLNSRRLLGISVLILSVLPFYQFGEMNDFLMRASIPALFVLAVLVGKAILYEAPSQKLRVVLVLIFILGSVTVGLEFRRHIVGLQVSHSIPIRANPVEIAGLWDVRAEVLSADSEKDFVAAQYGGGFGAPFFQFLAKHPD